MSLSKQQIVGIGSGCAFLLVAGLLGYMLYDATSERAKVETGDEETSEPGLDSAKDMFMAYNRATIYDAWGGTRRVYPWYVSILRRVKPEVVLTQDFNGEYGHAAHQITAYMTVKCIEYAADPTYDAKSFDAYGAWQVKKMYAHLYPENQIVMDWHQPLSAFGGKTGLEVAKDALWCHVSQRALTYQMLEEGPYDCRLFGLYFTAVGPDVAKNDFFENIP